MYGIPVVDAEAANVFGVDGGSVEHGDQVVRVGSSEARQFGITQDQCQNS